MERARGPTCPVAMDGKGRGGGCDPAVVAAVANRSPARQAAVRSDAGIDTGVRETVQSAYHPGGACKMGTDARAGVAPEGRVHGLAGLRVVDSSIMPAIKIGNLDAPTITIAEKVVDAIRGRRP